MSSGTGAANRLAPRAKRVPRGLALAAAAWGVLAAALMSAPVSGQSSGLVPAWGGGTLTVTGSGFRPGERVQLTVAVGQAQQTFTVTADGSGRITVPTGVHVPAGQGVKLDARGDMGTAMAAITGPSNLPPEPGGSSEQDTGQPAPLRRPWSGGPVVPAAAGIGLLVLITVVVSRRKRASGARARTAAGPQRG